MVMANEEGLRIKEEVRFDSKCLIIG